MTANSDVSVRYYEFSPSPTLLIVSSTVVLFSADQFVWANGPVVRRAAGDPGWDGMTTAGTTNDLTATSPTDHSPTSSPTPIASRNSTRSSTASSTSVTLDAPSISTAGTPRPTGTASAPSSGLSIAALIGIIVGALVGAIAFAIAAYLVKEKRKKTKRSKDARRISSTAGRSADLPAEAYELGERESQELRTVEKPSELQAYREPAELAGS
ncbi:hypothetical protein MGN70_003386 [Eutypa lata]|nr:hypothetical protein MGN70_003386 [Eutypa lata]